MVLVVDARDFNQYSRCVEWTGARTGWFTKTLEMSCEIETMFRG
jgi:hypothetical protein